MPQERGALYAQEAHRQLLFLDKVDQGREEGPRELLWYGATFVQSGIRFYRLTGSSL
jgi:hypothetical protein